jgi:hypothetical protein
MAELEQASQVDLLPTRLKAITAGSSMALDRPCGTWKVPPSG